MDKNGLLHYAGRKDHQIKLHGQRIELGEIERCLLDTVISACIVMKWRDDHLIAYVQSSDIDEEQLRKHCQSHLPSHMIPSMFIVLNKLPLNANGKIDRKLLPTPEFSTRALTPTIESNIQLVQLEERVHDAWCQTLDRNEQRISTTTSFFSIGGHSLLFIKLYHRYQSLFGFDNNALSIAPLLQQPTIDQHAKLLETVILNDTISTEWHALHINKGIASFAQERIFLDEQVRFTNEVAIYNELNVLRLAHGSLSTDRLLEAIRLVLNKHKVLQTSLVFDKENGIVQQCITNNHQTFTFDETQTFKNDDDDLNDIIYQMTTNPRLFDLSHGRVFHCQLLRKQNVDNDNQLLTNSDVIIIAFHHAAFDRTSRQVFFNDLCNAYNNNTTMLNNENSLQYIDYATYEHLMDMTLSRQFWHSQLEGCNLEKPLSLPADRHRSSIDHRSGLTSIAQMSFDNEILTSFFDYASSHQVTPFQLGLTIFYAFLFRLTDAQNDLCITCIDANRYRNELQNMIGMFVSTLPYRIQLDPHWSFDELVKHVREKCLSIFEHSHYPLQHILADSHLNQSSVSFLETVFDFVTISSNPDQLSLHEAILKQVFLKQSIEVAKFDFMLTFVYYPALGDGRLSCRIVCSRDLYDERTILNIAQRFQHLFSQIFSSKSNVTEFDQSMTPIKKLCLILPEETLQMKNVVYHKLPYIFNEGLASYAQARIWHDEQIYFHSDKARVAIYNMPFLYRLSSDHILSIKLLRQALHQTIIKHQSLRTSLTFDKQNNQLIQQIIHFNDNNNSLFSFIESIFETDEQLNNITYDEQRNFQHFDLNQGFVFRCHIAYDKQISPNDFLSNKDLIIFNFHHAMFDSISMDIFLHDLNQLYTTGQLTSDDNTNLRYLDYACIEQQMSMTAANMFWHDTLHNSKLDQSLPLPFDRYRLSNEHRTGLGTSISFGFNEHLSHIFLAYSSSNNIKLEHLTLACFYAFLFKLTNGERDLCVGMNTNGRFKEELISIIGMFDNTIPLRCQLDPHWSFHQLLEHVQEIITSSLEYSYFPLQRILNQHPNISKPAFLDISFDFQSNASEKRKNEIMIGDSRLCSMPFLNKISENEIMSTFDFAVILQHDLHTNHLSCTINASLDLFNTKTIETISQQFHSMLKQMFSFSDDDHQKKPIYELSLISPDEGLLMQSMNNTEVLFPSVTCIHHQFVNQAMEHPQKLAVELDEQSLSYGELLYYIQILSLNLLNGGRVIVGEIVCQCVERSLSMVIGMMAIEMVGGVYCPLSPRDPQHRLHTLIQQTQSRLILVHHLTKTKFNDDISSYDIDLILTDYQAMSDVDIDRLSNITVTPESIAYIIFTSGSTGIPKAVQVRHQDLSNLLCSLVNIDVLKRTDIVVQIAACTFDAHVIEILGTFLCSGTLVMLTPDGNMDFIYLSKTIENKEVTYILAVPTFLNDLYHFMNDNNVLPFSSIRTLCFGGEALSRKLIDHFKFNNERECIIWNLYGPAEVTIVSTYYQIDLVSTDISTPIGRVLANYRCIIMDEFVQSSSVGQEGELFVGGVGVFAGYLGRDDLTAKALIEIDGKIFYRTGDLVRMNDDGQLHYRGRKDHQIKLHGQRIELGEIERCLLEQPSISACVIIKWGDDHLIAYVQSSDNIDEKDLRKHCQSHLPPHMIPSLFIMVDKLPLNANGKIDRKLLPTPHFLTLTNIDSTESLPVTSLEKHLRCVFSEAFHTESPNINVSFGKMGGTSLDAIKALWLIRQQICTKIDASLLFANSSIRQLANAIEPLLAINNELSIASATLLLEEDQVRLMPSLSIEISGILLFLLQWLSPIWLAYQSNCPFTFLFVPVFHLLSYVIWQRLLLRLGGIENKVDKVYSWHYYRWWLLNGLWSINNFYWLKHLIGTPFYNSYLRWCGAKVGRHTHIYTTSIDAPWLLEVDESTFIGEEVILSSLSYQDQTYTLHPVHIGSHCTIDIGCVLYEGVNMQDYIFVKPMSAVTGQIPTSINHTSTKDRSLSLTQIMYQFICLLCLLFIHSIALLLAFIIYHYSSTWILPLFASLALSYFVWIVTNLFIVLFLLKFIVGSVTPGYYSLNSYYYLHKLWLRQLLISSYYQPLRFVPTYHVFASHCLNWLGAHIEYDVKIGDFQSLLRFPSNLLNIQRGSTTFGGVRPVPFEMTRGGECYLDKIHIGSGTNLGNGCALMPGTELPPNTIVGVLTLVTRETASRQSNIVLLGIPAREMPFVVPDNTLIENEQSHPNSLSIYTPLLVCLSFLIGKCLFIALYSSLPIIAAIVIHVMVCSAACRYLYSLTKMETHFTFVEIINHTTLLLRTSIGDFRVFVEPYLSGTQFLIFYYRALGARIGCDVILADHNCLSDHYLVTIGDHVRLNKGAFIQCHTFEQRLFKLAPVTVNHSSVLMNNTVILPGSTLHGQNRILPLTLVMKDDQLPPNTNWSGVPAQQTV